MSSLEMESSLVMVGSFCIYNERTTVLAFIMFIVDVNQIS